MAALSGFAGRVTVAGTNLTATRWQVQWRTDQLDASCFEARGGPSRAAGALDASGGWINPPAAAGQFSNQGEVGDAGVATPIVNWAAGITDIQCSIDAHYDTTLAPFNNNAPIVVPGMIVLVALALDRSVVGRAWDFSVLLESVTMDAEVRGIMRYSFTGKMAGASSGSSPVVSPV